MVGCCDPLGGERWEMGTVQIGDSECRLRRHSSQLPDGRSLRGNLAVASDGRRRATRHGQGCATARSAKKGPTEARFRSSPDGGIAFAVSRGANFERRRARPAREATKGSQSRVSTNTTLSTIDDPGARSRGGGGVAAGDLDGSGSGRAWPVRLGWAGHEIGDWNAEPRGPWRRGATASRGARSHRHVRVLSGSAAGEPASRHGIVVRADPEQH